MALKRLTTKFSTFSVEIFSVTRAGIILLLTYYLIGTSCLPSGDFSSGADITSIYPNCKAPEDLAITPLDFVSDHLINIDGMFNKHCKGDQQKPHSTPPAQHRAVQNISVSPTNTRHSFSSVQLIKDQPLSAEILYISGFFHKIFHPPVA
jgi:hypothetical protein